MDLSLSLVSLFHPLPLVLSCFVQHNDSTVEIICDLHSQLESCQFKSFWLMLRDKEDELLNVPHFKESIRNCERMGVA